MNTPLIAEHESQAEQSTRDVRIRAFKPLQSPAQLRTEMPLGDERAALVQQSRAASREVLTGQDDRLLVVVGPCSIHDPVSALDYAGRLAELNEELKDDLLIVMRTYFEKPRTVVGWKGLINDPHLDGSYDIHHGLRLARQILLDVLEVGLPVSVEFLEPTSPQYIADAVTWGAIGARTPESQVHRQLASGLSMPIGFKNASDGNLQAAIDGCRAAAAEQVFFGIDDDGRAASVATTGNPDCHVILRGGRSGPNYSAADVAASLDLLAKAGLPEHLMIDASHGNSGKDHIRQAVVAQDIAEQIAAGGRGGRGVVGVMLESFIEPGAQEPAASGLVYGKSVTDACMSWEVSADVLRTLATAVQTRRQTP